MSIASQLFAGPGPVPTRRQEYDPEERAILRERRRFLTDPAVAERLISHMHHSALPEIAGAKVALGSPLAKIESKIPKDDPRRGIGTKTMQEAPAAIAANPDLHPSEVVSMLYQRNLSNVAEPTYRAIRKDRASTWNTLKGLLGAEPSQRLAPMLGYDEWKAGIDKEAKSDWSVMPPWESAAIGAALPAAGFGLRKAAEAGMKAGMKGATVRWAAKSMGKTLANAPHPVAKLAGVALMAIPEFLAFDTAVNVVKNSEWAQNQGAVTNIAADLAAGGLGLMGARKVLKTVMSTKPVADLLSKSAATEEMFREYTGRVAQDPNLQNVLAVKSYSLKRINQSVKYKALGYNKEDVDEIRRAAAATGMPVDEVAGKYATQKALFEESGTAKLRTALKDRPDLLRHATEIEDLARTKYNMDPIAAIRAFDDGLAQDYWTMRIKAGIDKEPEYAKLLQEATDERVLRSGRAVDAITAEIGSKLPAFGEDTSTRQLGAAIKSTVGKKKLIPTSEEVNSLEEAYLGRTPKVAEIAPKVEAPKVAVPETSKIDKVTDVTTKAEREAARKAAAEKAVSPITGAGPVTKPVRSVAETKLEVKTDSGDRVYEAMKSHGMSPAGQKKALDELHKFIGPNATEVVTGSHVYPVGSREAAGQAAWKKYREDVRKGIPDEVEDVKETVKMAKDWESLTDKERNDLMSDLVEEADIDDVIAAQIPKMPAKGRGRTAVPAEEKALTAEVARPAGPAVNVGDTIRIKTPRGERIGVVTRLGKSGNPVVGKGENEIALTTEPYEVVSAEAIPAKKTRKKAGLADKLAIAGIISVPLATIGSLISPNDADAGMIDKFAKHVVNPYYLRKTMETTGKSRAEVLKMMDDAGLLGYPIDPANPKVLPKPMEAISVIPDLNNITYRGPKTASMWLASPGVIADYIYGAMKDGARALASPAVELAHRFNVVAPYNERTMRQVYANIVKDVPGWSDAHREVAKAKQVIVDAGYYKKINEAGALMAKIKANDTMFADFEKQIAKGKLTKREMLEQQELVDMTKGEQKELVARLNPLIKELGSLKELNTSIDKQLARQYPSVRVELATRGEGLEWLEPMLTEEEKTAAGHLRKFYDEIAVRANAVGEKTITAVPYGHFAIHPKANIDEARRVAEEILPLEHGGWPLAHLHHRTVGGFQVMPEMNYVMDRYLPDINKRIQMADFWKDGKKNGWKAHAAAVERLGWEGATEYWRGVRKAFTPYEQTNINKAMRIAYAFEVAMRLALSPSVAFKHAMKLEAPWSNFGIKETSQLIPATISQHMKAVAQDVAEAFGRKNQITDLQSEAMRTYTRQKSMTATISDLNMFEEPVGWAERALQAFNEKGAALVNFTERFDRAHSFLAAIDMAGKRGMTAEQAAYGVMDTILKNNFLNGIHNPEWLRNPKVRMLMMFQGTPFKILEQRVLLASRAAKAYSATAKETWNQLQNLRNDIKEGEKAFKIGLIKDAWNKEVDIYGNPMASQLLRKMMILGTAIYGGKALAESDLMEHFMHVPGVKRHEKSVSLSLNPTLTAALEATSSDDEFWTSSFFKRWLPSGPIPSIMTKLGRLSEDDIPERYRGSQFRYLFGIPALPED